MTREAWTQKTGMDEPPHHHWMYCFTVQNPEEEVPWFKKVYKSFWDEEPLHLREDFCGTGYLSAEWVASTPNGTAVGIDNDKPTIEWGEVKHLEDLGEAGARIKLLHLDVRDAPDYQSQIIHAGNNSWACLKERSELLAYFKRVHETLCDKGIFILDIYGGPSGFSESLQSRDCEMYHPESGEWYEYEYRWETGPVNPITHEQQCYIHFTRPCGEVVNKAYSYNWRIYSMPEVLDIMREAGLRPTVYWEGSDPQTGEGTEVYQPVKNVNKMKERDHYHTAGEYWTNYIICTKG